MWEIFNNVDIFRRSDWMDDAYYNPSNKQELLEKQKRDLDFNLKFKKSENN